MTKANPLPLINAFKAALDGDGITNEILIYKGLGHAFANPSGANYAPQQTADAWQKTLTFLSKNMPGKYFIFSISFFLFHFFLVFYYEYESSNYFLLLPSTLLMRDRVQI